MVGAPGTNAGKVEVALRKLIVVSALLGFGACASPGTPPGGPIDKTAPVLLGVFPDSGRARIKPPAVIFHFDETVSERPPGATSLDQLFLISPRDGTPSVDWHRKDITVKPSRGWRNNTTYVVTLLPGLADLRGNVRNTGAQTVFSTGSAVSVGSISGRIWNWVSGTLAQKAYIEAISLPDSVAYIAMSDSSGAFRVNNLPAGLFLVRGVIDENKSRGIDAREAWDSVTVRLADSASVALLAIARDTIAPVLATVSADDSATLRLSFEQALDPASLPTVKEVTVQASDSSRIPVLKVSAPPADTIAGAKRPPRPPPPQVLLVHLASALKPDAEYRVSISRVTGIAKTSAPAVRTFKTSPVPGRSPAIK